MLSFNLDAIEKKFINLVNKPIFLAKQSCSDSLQQFLYIKSQLLKNSFDFLKKENRRRTIEVADLTAQLISGFEKSINSNISNWTEFDFKLVEKTDSFVKYYSKLFDVYFKFPIVCFDALTELPSALNKFLDLIKNQNISYLNSTKLAEASEKGIENLNVFWNCLQNLLNIQGPFHHGKRQFQSSMAEISKRLSAAIYINEQLSRVIQDLRVSSTNLRDIQTLYATNKLTMADLRKYFSLSEYSRITGSLENLEESVRKLLIDPFLVETSRLIVMLVELYTNAMSTVNQFLENMGLEFDNPDKFKVRNDIRNFLIWRKPTLETLVFIKVNWIDNHPDTIRIWPMEQSLQAFLSNQGTSTIVLKSLITKCLSDSLTKVCCNLFKTSNC